MQRVTFAPRTKVEVVFTVPPGSDWAIFVNPSPERGPLLIARDVPLGVTGRLPISFGVDRQGNFWVAAPGGLGPGWFGE